MNIQALSSPGCCSSGIPTIALYFAGRFGRKRTARFPLASSFHLSGRRDLGCLQKEWQNEVQLPSFFYGGAGCPEGRGSVAKRIAVQCRSSLKDQQVVSAKVVEDYAAVISCLPVGGDDPPMRGVRCYTSAPNQQSIMDSIIFNRVFDWRSRELHDK
ncbi:unnamed protein product, partial [Symbiodinium microadriaticum]